MSYDEYSKINHEIPYFYIHRSKNQSIYYFGSNHSHDPNHPQFNLLKEKWNEFIDKSKKSERTIIVEAKENSNKETTFEKSIIKHGEVGAGCYLANESKLLLTFGEPKDDDIVNHLLKNFSKEEILLFFESIAISFWQKHRADRDIEEFLSKHTNKYRKLLNWPELIISVEFINKIYKEIFNKEMNINDEETFSEINTPVIIKSRINELSRSQSKFRNEYILDQIEKYWGKGYNIFVIYGAGHAVMQERAIKSLICGEN